MAPTKPSETNPLDAIVKTADAEPPELPRLTSFDVFRVHNLIGTQLSLMVDHYKSMSNTNQRQALDDLLREIIKGCQAISGNAVRLLEANR